MGGKKKKGSKASNAKKTNPPGPHVPQSPQSPPSHPSEHEPADGHPEHVDYETDIDEGNWRYIRRNGDSGVVNKLADEHIEHPDFDDVITDESSDLGVGFGVETEASQQQSSAPVAFDAPTNVDEMRELNSTSAWALDPIKSDTPTKTATRKIPQEHTPTLSDYADTGFDAEDEGASEYAVDMPESAVAFADGEMPAEETKDSRMAVYSEKAFRELQTKCKKLEQDLAKKTRDLKSAQHSAAAAHEEAAKVKANHAKEVKEELKTQREQLNDQHSNDVSDLEKRLSADLEKTRL